MNSTNNIGLVMENYPDLGYDGWRIEPDDRLFAERLAPSAHPQPDDEGRIRIDDWEMRDDVQAEVKKFWATVDTEHLGAEADQRGYHTDFLRLFGFGFAGVDYSADVPDELI